MRSGWFRRWRRLARYARVAFTAAALLAAGVAPAGAQPRVRVIATGGTIANHADGRLSAEALVQSTESLAAVAKVEAETFSSATSLALSFDDWLRLSRRIGQALRDPELAGVVVTSGTDTLEELAWFLDLTVRSERPVVVTGAMRRPSEADADGPRNLTDAVTVAADRASRRRGTLVVMQGDILAARDATKVSVSAPRAFASTGGEALGTIDQGRARFVRDLVTRHNGTSEFDAGTLPRMPRVDLLVTYQQAPGDLVDAVVRAGARGVVIAGAGIGSTSGSQADAIMRAIHAGASVVIASRVPGGMVAAADVPAGAVAAGTLAPVKARILLMLALARRLDRGDIARVFREY